MDKPEWFFKRDWDIWEKAHILEQALEITWEQLEEITRILGSGGCKANKCEGCSFEMAQVSSEVKETLRRITELSK